MKENERNKNHHNVIIDILIILAGGFIFGINKMVYNI